MHGELQPVEISLIQVKRAYNLTFFSIRTAPRIQVVNAARHALKAFSVIPTISVARVRVPRPT